MTFSWAAGRRLSYASITLVVVIGIAYLLISPYLTTAPTCMDGRKNGDEQGVDCGGSCLRYCPAQMIPPITLWTQSFPVTPRVYNALAYIENQNPTAAALQVPYEFRLYDEQGVLLAVREGVTYINPNGRQPIFEGGIPIENRVPVRTVFRITGPVTWYKTAFNPSLLPLRITDIRASNTETTPRVTALITNTDLRQYPSVPVVVLVFNEEGNIVGFSRTITDVLPAGATEQLFFTWNYPFEEGVYTYVITPVPNVLSLPPEYATPLTNN